MIISKMWNGFVVRLNNGCIIDVRLNLWSWSLPVGVYWINAGKDLQKSIGIQILCLSIELDNGKPPF